MATAINTDKIKDNLEILNKYLNELIENFENIKDTNDNFTKICEGEFNNTYKEKLDILNKNIQKIRDKKEEINVYVNNIIGNYDEMSTDNSSAFELPEFDESTSKVSEANLGNTKFSEDATIKNLLTTNKGLEDMVKQIMELGWTDISLNNTELWNAFANYYIRAKEIELVRDISEKTEQEMNDLILWLQNEYSIDKRSFDMTEITLNDEKIYQDMGDSKSSVKGISSLFKDNPGLEDMVKEIIEDGKTDVALTSPLWAALSDFYIRAKEIKQERILPKKTEQEMNDLILWLQNEYSIDKRPFDITEITLDDKEIYQDMGDSESSVKGISSLFKDNPGLEDMVKEILKNGKTDVALTSPLWAAFSDFYIRAKEIKQERILPEKSKAEKDALDSWLKETYASDNAKLEEANKQSNNTTANNEASIPTDESGKPEGYVFDESPTTSAQGENNQSTNNEASIPTDESGKPEGYVFDESPTTSAQGENNQTTNNEASIPTDESGKPEGYVFDESPTTSAQGENNQTTNNKASIPTDESGKPEGYVFEEDTINMPKGGAMFGAGAEKAIENMNSNSQSNNYKGQYSANQYMAQFNYDNDKEE